MPNVGSTEFRHGRWYIYTQPDASKGPGTWRPSNPDAIAGGGGGGGGGTGGTVYDFDAVPPVNVTQTPQGSGPTRVVTHLDFTNLDARSN